jgi:hypothetical protein
MKTKDIPELPILQFLDGLGRWGTIFSGFENSVERAMPPETPRNMVRSKMQSLVSRGLVDGCVCGCRGDFELTPKGRVALTKPPDRAQINDEE